MRVVSEQVLAGDRLPPRLRELEQPPSRVFVRGELPRAPAVAIVGTREPSFAGKRYARSLARELAQAGVVVMSGGAEGIDTAAHRGALDVGGTTVVVAPGGFDQPYPRENARLFRRVVQRGGAYLSLVPADVPAMPHAFFARNAVLVALAHVVVVAEAPYRSGARNAAKYARRLGRPLLVVPSAPHNQRGLGCIAELKLGATPLASARDVLRILGAERLHPVRAITPSRQRSRSAPPALRGQLTYLSDGRVDPEAAKRVVEAVRAGAAYADDVCTALGLSGPQIQQLLLTLTLEGVLVCATSGRIRIVNDGNYTD
jgi:DNA processing protein